MLPRTQNWLVGGAATFMVFFLSLFIKEQQDVTAVQERERNHSETDEKQFVLMQAQIDRRIEGVEKSFMTGRSERMNTDTSLGARIDTLRDNLNSRIDDIQVRLAEIQRQVAAIEGKLGESIPNLPPVKR